MTEWLLTAFGVLGALLLFAISRAQSNTRRRNELSRSNARVVGEIKRIAVRDPRRIIETADQ